MANDNLDIEKMEEDNSDRIDEIEDLLDENTLRQSDISSEDNASYDDDTDDESDSWDEDEPMDRSTRELEVKKWLEKENHELFSVDLNDNIPQFVKRSNKYIQREKSSSKTSSTTKITPTVKKFCKHSRRTQKL